ncbi:hypothetical protein ACFFWD_02490 [Bradyrhizobium erythrophlei]|uniref:hypothetical protein n=1 Tax=Bradyrhizobium erythrophlei TaxID=1437360 RepID=UPI0035EDFA9D
MAQEFQTSRLQTGRTQSVDRRWLSMLIDAMEHAARPKIRNTACDAAVISAVSAHLAQPASAFGHCGSAYSLRN